MKVYPLWASKKDAQSWPPGWLFSHVLEENRNPNPKQTHLPQLHPMISSYTHLERGFPTLMVGFLWPDGAYLAPFFGGHLLNQLSQMVPFQRGKNNKTPQKQSLPRFRALKIEASTCLQLFAAKIWVCFTASLTRILGSKANCRRSLYSLYLFLWTSFFRRGRSSTGTSRENLGGARVPLAWWASKLQAGAWRW